MTDTAQERVEGERADLEDYCRWSEGIAGKLERKYGGGDPEAETPVEIAAATYLRKLASEVRRLRARQRKEGDNCTCPRWAEQHGWDSECPRHGYDWDRACDYEDHVPGDSSYGRTGRDHGAVPEVRGSAGDPPGRREQVHGTVARRGRHPQREDDRLVPEACPHCSGLMGHWGDCPHGLQRKGDREPVAWRWRLKGSSMGWIYWPEAPTDIAEPHDWDIQPLYAEPGVWNERLAGALASALSSAELVRRRGNEPDWWRCSACWSTGRGPGEIEHEPDCPEAVYEAWKADTGPPANTEEGADG